MNGTQLGLFDLLEECPELFEAPAKGGRKIELLAKRKRRPNWRETDPMTFAEIGERLGVSRQRVKVIYDQAIEKIRQIVMANPQRFERLHAYLEEIDAVRERDVFPA